MGSKISVLIVGAIALSACASLSSEAPSVERGGDAVTVVFADLDPSSTAGARILRGRVFAAARQVCAQSVGSEATRQPKERACLEQIMEDYDARPAHTRSVANRITVKAVPGPNS